MRILLSFGDAQLRFVIFRHPLAEGVCQGSGWIRAWGFDIRCILGQLDEIDLRHFLTGETVEIVVDEGAGDFARAIGTEVHEDQRIAIFHGGIGLAFSADHGCLHKFVVFITRVSRFQAFNGGRELELAFCQGQQIIGLLNAVPAVVAVHGIVTTNDGRHAAFAQCGKFVFKRFKRTFCAAWRRIATIQEGVQIDFFRTALSGQFYHRHDVIFVAVNTARREQTHNVNGLACGNGFINRSGERWVGKECTFFDFNVQARQVLINDTARTQVNVTHF